MKDESSLDSLGPLAIIGFLVLVLGVSVWIMRSYQGDWGSGHRAAPPVAEAPEAAH